MRAALRRGDLPLFAAQSGHKHAERPEEQERSREHRRHDGRPDLGDAEKVEVHRKLRGERVGKRFADGRGKGRRDVIQRTLHHKIAEKPRRIGAGDQQRKVLQSAHLHNIHSRPENLRRENPDSIPEAAPG